MPFIYINKTVSDVNEYFLMRLPIEKKRCTFLRCERVKERFKSEIFHIILEWTVQLEVN